MQHSLFPFLPSLHPEPNKQTLNKPNTDSPGSLTFQEKDLVPGSFFLFPFLFLLPVNCLQTIKLAAPIHFQPVHYELNQYYVWTPSILWHGSHQSLRHPTLHHSSPFPSCNKPYLYRARALLHLFPPFVGTSSWWGLMHFFTPYSTLASQHDSPKLENPKMQVLELLYLLGTQKQASTLQGSFRYRLLK